MTTQPEALRLAAALENEHDPWPRLPAAAELRRLHEENERIGPLAERVLELEAQRDALLKALKYHQECLLASFNAARQHQEVRSTQA